MEAYDVVIRRGTIFDGSGSAPFTGELAIRGDRIVALAPRLSEARGSLEVDAAGLAVAPGFINMLSWATESLIQDGRSQSDIRQGVTLEIFGEGRSMGPLNQAMKDETLERQADIRYPIAWTTLGEYLDHLVARGVSCNVASFVGATTLRVHEVGYADRPPTSDELERMRGLVREAMDELIEIARESGAPAEIYHLKASGAANWSKLDSALERIEAARAEGLRITADMYTYTAGSTGLGATMPPWVQEGGQRAWVERLKDPATRARIKHEMNTPTDAWE